MALVAFINSLALWLTMHHVLDEGDAAPYPRCLLASTLLSLLVVPFALAYFLIPIPALGAAIGLAIAAKGAQMIVAGLFALPRGGTLATAIVLMVTAGVWLGFGFVLRGGSDPVPETLKKSNDEFLQRALAEKSDPPKIKEAPDATLAIKKSALDPAAAADLVARDPLYCGLQAVAILVTSDRELLALGPKEIELQRRSPSGDWIPAPLARIVPARADGYQYTGGATYNSDGSPAGSVDTAHPETAANFPPPRHYSLYFMISPEAAQPLRLAIKTAPNLWEWKAVVLDGK